MPVGRTHSISLLGMTGAVVEIEADISNQLPMFVLIGLPDAALNEAKDRVRSAITNSGLELPHRKVTINLSPAALLSEVPCGTPPAKWRSLHRKTQYT